MHKHHNTSYIQDRWCSPVCFICAFHTDSLVIDTTSLKLKPHKLVLYSYTVYTHMIQKLHRWIYLCTYIYIYTHIYICTYIDICICLFVFCCDFYRVIRICVYMCIYTSCICLCVCVRMRYDVYVCVYIYICQCVRMCV